MRVERLLNDGKVLRTPEITEATWIRRRPESGRMKACAAKRLKEFEAENARLKGWSPTGALDVGMPKDLAEGNF